MVSLSAATPASIVSTTFRKRAFINILYRKFGMTKAGEMHPANAGHKDSAKLLLLQDAQACSLCERMTCSRRVLSDLNGHWNADIVFVAEAPGRLGAEKTGIPLFGDRTGDRFEELLRAMRL